MAEQRACGEALSDESVRARWHTCPLCHREFVYRYEGHYAALHLMPIDFVCGDCLPCFAVVRDPTVAETPA